MKHLRFLLLFVAFILAACGIPETPPPQYITPMPEITTTESAELLGKFQAKQEELYNHESVFVTFLVENNACMVVLEGDYSSPHQATNNMVSFSFRLREKSVRTGYPSSSFTTICGAATHDAVAFLQPGNFATIVGNTGEVINLTYNYKDLLKYRNWYLSAIDESNIKPS